MTVVTHPICSKVEVALTSHMAGADLMHTVRAASKSELRNNQIVEIIKSIDPQRKVLILTRTHEHRIYMHNLFPSMMVHIFGQEYRWKNLDYDTVFLLIPNKRAMSLFKENVEIHLIVDEDNSLLRHLTHISMQ